MHSQGAHRGPRSSTRWGIILVAAVMLVSSLGCSLAKRIEPLVLAASPEERVGAQDSPLATRTPWPTFTPTLQPSPTATFTSTPLPIVASAETGLPSSTPMPTSTAAATATLMPVPTATPWPTNTRAPVPPTATPTPTAVPTPSFSYEAVEVFKSYTSNAFLTGYVAIVNHQEIPIGGVKAVGSFEPGGQRYESPLSKWFFDVATAPGAEVKSGSVKFEPGGIMAGTWFIHLEDEWGTRLSDDVSITTDPANPEWFFVKFKQSAPVQAIASASTGGAGTSAYASNPASTIPTPGSTPTRYPTATPVMTPMTSTDGWTFARIRSAADQSGLIVYGDLVNDTASTQQISQVTGIFYNGQGQVIAGPDDTYGFWPVEVVPSGGRMPFELVVSSIQGAEDFDLSVVSQPIGESPRQDFEFLGGDISNTDGSYCVISKLRNPGSRLSHYLVISAALYNAEGRTINFDNLEVPTPGLVVGDKMLNFSMCIKTLNQEVADYELQAWGR